MWQGLRCFKESKVRAADKLAELAIKKSDINEHLHEIKKLASSCDHVTEFGVRNVVSTWALLAACPKKLVCYDIHDCPVGEIAEAAVDSETEFFFTVADVLSIDIEKTDMLMIDTLHTYHQLLSELSRHAGRVNKWIVMHDTETFGLNDEEVYYPTSPQENHGKTGLVAAIDDFLASDSSWERKRVYTHNNGLTVLGKR